MQNMEVERVFIGAGCNRVVNNVSWGASGLVSFGAQNAVAIFSPKTAQILTTLPGHKASVNCTLWLPNSKFAFKVDSMQQMDPAKQAKVMQDFQRQSAQLDMTTEMMSDAIDDAIDDDEAEEETEDLTNQVLDEIGIDVASQLSAAPKGKISGKRTEESSSSGIDELEKRLAALRNP